MRGHRRQFDWLDVLFTAAIVALFVGGLVSVRHWYDTRADDLEQDVKDNQTLLAELCDAVQVAVPAGLDNVAAIVGADDETRARVRTAFVDGLPDALARKCAEAITAITTASFP